MRLPSKKRPGNPILANDWNLLIDALEARTPRPGPGTEIIAATGGFSFRVRPTPASTADVKPIPLTLLPSRPLYIPAPVAPPPPPEPGVEPPKPYYIEWGHLNDTLAKNWDSKFDVSVTTYFFAKAKLRSGETLLVTEWEVVTGAAFDTHKTPDWLIGADRPEYIVISLGAVFVDTETKTHTVVQSGGGSISVKEHITSIQSGGSSGTVKFGKELTYQRLLY